MRANQVLLDLINRYAEEKRCTAAQISLAWVMYSGHIVPIPGMRSDARILENLGAAEVTITADEYAAMNEALSHITRKSHGRGYCQVGDYRRASADSGQGGEIVN